MVRLRRWFVALALEVRKLERIFWKRSARKDLLGVEMSMGKSVCNSLQSIQCQFQVVHVNGLMLT